MTEVKKLLTINKLNVNIDNKNILKNVNLEIKENEIHAIMGPNGSGKSTLSKVLANHPEYTVKSGEINYNGKSILDLTTEERAYLGIFLSMQYPVAIPGVSNAQFLKTSVNAIYKHQGKKSLDAIDFLKLAKDKMAQIKMPEDFLSRSLNEGFSGGEKKRNEILQMLLLEPKLAILDETDSGLDIDALKTIAESVNSMRGKCTFILITHYQRLLDYIKPDVVHVLDKGTIIHTGDSNLPKELEVKGYNWLTEGEGAT